MLPPQQYAAFIGVIRRRNRRELIALGMSWLALAGVSWTLLSRGNDTAIWGLFALGTVGHIGTVIVLLTLGRPAEPTGQETRAELAEALQRQGRLLLWAPVWYVLPILLPVALLLTRSTQSLWTAGILGIVALGGSLLNRRVGRRMLRDATA